MFSNLCEGFEDGSLRWYLIILPPNGIREDIVYYAPGKGGGGGISLNNPYLKYVLFYFIVLIIYLFIYLFYNCDIVPLPLFKPTPLLCPAKPSAVIVRI